MMAITDEHGNKLPQPRMNKLTLSAKFREIAKHNAQNNVGRRCTDCGYHIRSKNHDAGAHHKGTVVPCRR